MAQPIPAAAPAIRPQTVVQPALQAFGAAMRRAFADERKPVTGEPAPAPAVTLPTATIPSAPAEPAPLDMRDARWPDAMVQHIERLRDLAEPASTHLRLLPDALGPVDVSVRREGDAVHVQLTAASPETRQLLQDAQPRLAEAAEQRGVRLARTEVSAGSADASQPGPGRQPSRTPAQLPRAPRRAAIAADLAADTRIA